MFLRMSSYMCRLGSAPRRSPSSRNCLQMRAWAVKYPLQVLLSLKILYIGRDSYRNTNMFGWLKPTYSGKAV